jgi:hypothetical protein
LNFLSSNFYIPWLSFQINFENISNLEFKFTWSKSLTKFQISTFEKIQNLSFKFTWSKSLANSSITNHKPWRSHPSPAFQTMLRPQHRTSLRSSHITIDGRPTFSTLNIIKMERLVWRLKTTGLSNTTNHKNPILKYEGLGN